MSHFTLPFFGIMPARSVVKCGWFFEVPNQSNFCFHIKAELIGRTSAGHRPCCLLCPVALSGWQESGGIWEQSSS